ncbi:hypothetical protein MMC16_000874 [Acarospora aff. strigata]|nr:hypothetical protein [Acarospora aff. strigata]
MLYRNILLEGFLLGLCSTAFATPLETRGSGLIATTSILEKLEETKSLNWVDKAGGKVKAVTIPPGEWAAAEAAINGKRRRSPISSESNLQPRQNEIKDIGHVKCYGSGSWAYDTTLVPLITSICDEGALNWYLDAGSAQVLHFLGLKNEAGDGMSVFVTLTSHVDGIYSGLDAAICTTMATTLILQECQGKNQDTRGGVITGKNLSGKDSVSLAIDPTTKQCKGKKCKYV